MILYVSCVASRLRIATNERAEAEKILQVKRAEGEAESKYLSGVGVARQRQAIVDGLRESVLAFSSHVDGTSPKDVLDMVLLTQYFDTMKVCKPWITFFKYPRFPLFAPFSNYLLNSFS